MKTCTLHYRDPSPLLRVWNLVTRSAPPGTTPSPAHPCLVPRVRYRSLHLLVILSQCLRCPPTVPSLTQCPVHDDSGAATCVVSSPRPHVPEATTPPVDSLLHSFRRPGVHQPQLFLFVNPPFFRVRHRLSFCLGPQRQISTLSTQVRYQQLPFHGSVSPSSRVSLNSPSNPGSVETGSRGPPGEVVATPSHCHRDGGTSKRHFLLRPFTSQSSTHYVLGWVVSVRPGPGGPHQRRKSTFDPLSSLD